jgi:hypothetical protein
MLRELARFDDSEHSFLLLDNPFAPEAIHPGPYRMGKRVEDANTYRVGHPLAQHVLDLGVSLATPPAEMVFRYAAGGKKITLLEPLIGASGWLACARLTVSAMETEDHLFLAGSTDAGEALDDACCRRLFDLPAAVECTCSVPDAIAARLADAHARHERELLEELAARNGRWFDQEMDKLDRWAEDRRSTLRAALDGLDAALKVAKRAARVASTLPEKLERQREARTLEAKRDEAWRVFDQASRDLDRQKDALLDDIGTRLEQTARIEPLFTVRWWLE